MTHHHRTTIAAEPGKQEIVITREFDALRELVFKVVTDPELLPQWWGPRYLSTIVDQMDVRPGGQWRFINRDAQGNAYGFHGVYHEVLAPERIIDTFEIARWGIAYRRWCRCQCWQRGEVDAHSGISA